MSLKVFNNNANRQTIYDFLLVVGSNQAYFALYHRYYHEIVCDQCDHRVAWYCLHCCNGDQLLMN